jgi:UDP-N-acetyl-2-amino-2-deoxyglucuronate dehydrogenase
VVTVTRDLIAAGTLGRPMTAVMVDDQYFPIQGHYRSTWRGDVSLVGAGTLLEHAIHDIDILISYFGRLRRVHGVTRHFFEKKGVEDLSAATLEFESGAVVSHTSIWHNLLARGSSRRMLVIGEDGQLAWQDDDWSAAIRIDANESGARELSSAEVVERYIESAGVSDARLAETVRAPYAGQDYLLEDYAFLRAVTEGRPASPGLEVAVYAHEVVDAIYASAREGRALDLA